MRVGLGMDMTCPTPSWAWTSMHHGLELGSVPQAQHAWVHAARLDPFLIFNGSVPNTPRVFSRDSMRVSWYFILIKYVLFWVKYNSKYHKGGSRRIFSPNTSRVFWVKYNSNGSAPNTPRVFSQDSMQVSRYFILIKYVLFWVKYNSKYHKR